MPLARSFVGVTLAALFLSGSGVLQARDAEPALIVASPQSHSLYSELTLPNAEMEGFDIDLLDSAGRIAGRDTQFVPSRAIDHALDLLKTGRVDAAAGIPLVMGAKVHDQGAILIPYREEELHAYVRQEALYRHSNDLAKATLALPEFSSALTYVKSLGWNVVVTRDYAEAFELLESSKADAVLCEKTVARQFVAPGHSIEFRRLAEPVFATQIGLAVNANFEGKDQIGYALNTVSRIGQRDRLERSWGLLLETQEASPSPLLLIAYAGLILIAALLVLTRATPTRHRRPFGGINTQPAYPGRHI